MVFLYWLLKNLHEHSLSSIFSCSQSIFYSVIRMTNPSWKSGVTLLGTPQQFPVSFRKPPTPVYKAIYCLDSYHFLLLLHSLLHLRGATLTSSPLWLCVFLMTAHPFHLSACNSPSPPPLGKPTPKCSLLLLLKELKKKVTLNHSILSRLWLLQRLQGNERVAISVCLSV